MRDPLSMFSEWYDKAQKDALISPDIVALATATPEGRPSVRMVFFRGIREGGFSFFTNYESRKGDELQANPFAAMTLLSRPENWGGFKIIPASFEFWIRGDTVGIIERCI